VGASVDPMSPGAGFSSSSQRAIEAKKSTGSAQARPLILYLLAGFGLFAFLAIVVFLLVVLVKGLNPAGAEPGGTGDDSTAIHHAADE